MTWRGGRDAVGVPEPGVLAGSGGCSHGAHRGRRDPLHLVRHPDVRVTDGNRGDRADARGRGRRLLLRPRGSERLAGPEETPFGGWIQKGEAGGTWFPGALK